MKKEEEEQNYANPLHYFTKIRPEINFSFTQQAPKFHIKHYDLLFS